MLSDHKDFLTAKGARAIADHINTFWREQGVAGIVAYPVQRPGSEEYDVRSNMVGGLAPKAVTVAAGVSRAEAKRIAEIIRQQSVDIGRGVRAR